MDPLFLHDAFPLDDKDLESPLIFVLFFLRGKKKTLSVTSYLEKTGLWKTESRFRGHVTYWEDMVKTVPPL